MAVLDKILINGTQYDIKDASVAGQISTATAGLANGIEYDSNSERINLKHDSTVLGFIDASQFIVDGFLDSVEIRDVVIQGETVTCLVFTWNTDSGKQSVNIPLSDIFDADNYYTKNEVDTELADKQDTLVSGTNIKTVGGTSILGTGDIPFPAGITVDSALSTTSENPVQNKVITGALNNKANTADLSAVASSGAYSDLSGTPFIPTVTYDAQDTALVINTVAPQP